MKGLILAGGRSRRMGDDKAARFAPRVLAALSPITPDVWLSLREGQAPPLDLPVVRDPGEGPLGGILSAFDSVGDDLLVVACDLPRVTSDLLGWIADHSADHDVVVPVAGSAPQVLCALWCVSAHATARAAWERGVRAPRDVLADLDVVYLPAESRAEELRSFDRPEDLVRL